jgi:hypothetical protein
MAAMAPKNKCLAQMNKSGDRVRATKKGSALRFTVSACAMVHFRTNTESKMNIPGLICMLVTFLVLLLPMPANAQVTGNVLLKWCTKNDPQCNAYLLGVTDTIIALSPSGICMPDTHVNQQRAVVVRFLKERPHHLQYLVVDVIMKAYEEAWPCSK